MGFLNFMIKTWVPSAFALSLACCCAMGPLKHLSFAQAKEAHSESQTIERDYLIKGMTCSGCVFGVKKALERAGISRSRIVEVEYNKPDPENKIGHAKVRFPKDEYKGKETDCKIAKEIRSNPGYHVFWDMAEQNPCNL